MRKRGAQAAAVAALVVLATAGCSNASPQPKPLSTKTSDSTPTASPTPTQTPSPSPTKVVETDGGDGHKVDAATKQAISAFTRQYLDAQNNATKNGDFSAVHKLIRNCSLCDQSEATIAPVYRKGGRITGGLFANPTILIGDVWTHGFVQAHVEADETAYKVYDKSGKVVGSGGAEHHTYLYSVSKVDGSWKIIDGRVTK